MLSYFCQVGLFVSTWLKVRKPFVTLVPGQSYVHSVLVVESMSKVKGASTGPAPAFQARASSSPLTASSQAAEQRR